MKTTPVVIVIPVRHMLAHETYFFYQNTRHKSLKVKSTNLLHY